MKKGAKESAKLEASGIDMNKVLTEVSGEYLRVHLQDDDDYRGSLIIKVYITYVDLDDISASASSHVEVEGINKTRELDINASSSASIELAVESDVISAHVSSSGDVKLAGKARRFSIETSSGGTVDAYNLECEEVEANASSGGRSEIMVTKNLRAEASSGGSIRYRGNPSNRNTESTSGGSVEKSD